MHQRITKPQTLWLSREFSNQCDRVIAPSQGTADLLRSYGITAPLEIVPGGVDLESFGLETPEPAVIRDARPGPVVLSVGRLGKEKNLDVLLDAFGLFLRSHPGARLIMVGDGPYREELERRAETIGASGRVVFVGALDQAQLGAYYRSADVFLFTSLTETQGLVLVEALAHGLPVVAVDCPVTREIIIGESGILTPESAGALADAVASVINAPAQRATRVAAARRAAAPFSIDALAERLETLYLSARSELTDKGNFVFTRRQR